MSTHSFDEDFVAHLLKLRDDPQNGRAAMATLRRGVAVWPAYSFEMLRYLGPFLSTTRSESEEQNLLLIASLFALHPVDGAVGNLGDSFRIAAGNEQKKVATERRFAILLAADAEDLGQHLIRAITFLRSCDTPVQWARLSSDVRMWDHPNGYIQRNWARSFWRASPGHAAAADATSADPAPESA